MRKRKVKRLGESEEENAKSAEKEYVEPIKSSSAEDATQECKEQKIQFDIKRPYLTLDTWQKEYIEHQGNTLLCCGRQVGKTTAASIKIAEKAINTPHSIILVTAYTEKQAINLYLRTLQYLKEKYPKEIKEGKERPTLHFTRLKNGSTIMCHAAGTTGYGIVGFTITDLFVDEAALMNDGIFQMLTPSLSVTGGTINLISTPKGKQGYFYECSQREDFRKWFISAEDCPRHSKEFLEGEKNRMPKLIYAQEYLAQFIDELRRMFPDELLERCAVVEWREPKEYTKRYLGVDVGGLGEDISAYEILEKVDNEIYEHIQSHETRKTYTTEVIQKILELEKKFKFKAIGIDNGGLGVGVFHPLLKEKLTKNKIVGLNNASRSLDEEGRKKTTLLKEDMYFNLLSMMENGKIRILKSDEVIASLKSIQYEIVNEEMKKIKYKIWGDNSHHTEALIRAAWLAYQDKSLQLWVSYR